MLLAAQVREAEASAAAAARQREVARAELEQLLERKEALAGEYARLAAANSGGRQQHARTGAAPYVGGAALNMHPLSRMMAAALYCATPFTVAWPRCTAHLQGWRLQ